MWGLGQPLPRGTGNVGLDGPVVYLNRKPHPFSLLGTPPGDASLKEMEVGLLYGTHCWAVLQRHSWLKSRRLQVRFV